MLNGYEDYNYRENSGFLSGTKQIVDALKNSENSIKEGFKSQSEAIEAQTALQHQDAEETRNSLTNVFGALARTLKNIFTKDKGDIQEETFYEMVQRENNETQAYLEAHTSTMKQESDQTQEIMNAQTAELATIGNNITISADKLKEAIEASTDESGVNFDKLVEILRTEGDKIDTTLSDGNTKAEQGYSNIVDAIRNEVISSGTF